MSEAVALLSAPVSASPPPVASGGRTSGPSFHEVFSALNPLQYLPVVGTIYRALTDDQISEPLRRFGSVIASGLMGGPIGIILNIASLAVEKAAGVDLDGLGRTLIAGPGPAPEPRCPDGDSGGGGQSLVTPSRPATCPGTVPQLMAGRSPGQARRHGAAETSDVSGQRDAILAARTPDAADHPSPLTAADRLNAIELDRIRGAQLAYGRTASLAA